jgi:hypothetical protein
MVDGKREKEMSNTAVSTDDNNSTTTTTTAGTPRYYLYSSKPDVIPSATHTYRQITLNEFQRLERWLSF